MLTTTVRRVHRYVGLPHPHPPRPRGQRGHAVPLRPRPERDVPRRAQDRARAARRARGRWPGASPSSSTATCRRAGRRSSTHKAGRWKLALHRRALRALVDPEQAEESSDELLEEEAEEHGLRAEDVELGPGEAAELDRRLAAAASDVPSLLLCGLVRSDVQVGGTPPAQAVLDAPADRPPTSPRATERMAEYDEDKALLDSAVKANDGFFTTFFVSPYSQYIARWAANRGWTPNGVTTLSVVHRASWPRPRFATGERWGMVAGAVLLQLAFTFDCVDGQLARYTRTFTKLGAWLDSIFDRTKEYVVFAGLAIGASRTGDDVWLLAGAALTLQVLRHSIDFSFRRPSTRRWRSCASRRSSRCSDSSHGAPVPAAHVPEGGDEPGEARVAPPPEPSSRSSGGSATPGAASTARGAAAGSRRSSASRSASASRRSRSPPRCSTRA